MNPLALAAFGRTEGLAQVSSVGLDLLDSSEYTTVLLPAAAHVIDQLARRKDKPLHVRGSSVKKLAEFLVEKQITTTGQLAVVLLASLQVYVVYADDKSAALTVVSDTADRICGVVATQGEAHSSKVSGNVQTELSGLARYLASIGVSGAGEITSSSYQNVLQQELATALRDVRDCKLKVFDRLVEIVFSTPPQRQGSNTVPGVPGRTIGIQIIKCKIGSDEVTTEVSGNNMLTTTNYGSAKVYSQSREWGTITRQDDPDCPAILYTSRSQSSRLCISTRGMVSVLGSGIWVGNCEICDTAGNCYTPQIP